MAYKIDPRRDWELVDEFVDSRSAITARTCSGC